MLFIRFAVTPPAPAMVTRSRKLSPPPTFRPPSHPAPPMVCTRAAAADTAVTNNKEFQGTKSIDSQDLCRGKQAPAMMSAAIEVLNRYGMGEAKTGIKTATTGAQIVNSWRYCALVDVPETATSSFSR